MDGTSHFNLVDAGISINVRMIFDSFVLVAPKSLPGCLNPDTLGVNRRRRKEGNRSRLEIYEGFGLALPTDY